MRACSRSRLATQPLSVGLNLGLGNPRKPSSHDIPEEARTPTVCDIAMIRKVLVWVGICFSAPVSLPPSRPAPRTSAAAPITHPSAQAPPGPADAPPPSQQAIDDDEPHIIALSGWGYSSMSSWGSPSNTNTAAPDLNSAMNLRRGVPGDLSFSINVMAAPMEATSQGGILKVSMGALAKPAVWVVIGARLQRSWACGGLCARIRVGVVAGREQGNNCRNRRREASVNPV